MASIKVEFYNKKEVSSTEVELEVRSLECIEIQEEIGKKFIPLSEHLKKIEELSYREAKEKVKELVDEFGIDAEDIFADYEDSSSLLNL